MFLPGVLEKIRTWPIESGWAADLFAFVSAHWNMVHGTLQEAWAVPDLSSDQADGRYLSTGGWSYNEGLIGALQSHTLWWSLCWVQSRRGGGYWFEIPRDAETKARCRRRRIIAGG